MIVESCGGAATGPDIARPVVSGGRQGQHRRQVCEVRDNRDRWRPLHLPVHF